MICLMCELKKYPIEKLLDLDFFIERLGEFYPIEEFGGWAAVCNECHEDVQNYYADKDLNSEKETN